MAQEEVNLSLFNRLVGDKSILRQRHIYVTPTYIHFKHSDFIESNKILRKYEHLKHLFMRVTFVSDQLRLDQYWGDNNRGKLEHIH